MIVSYILSGLALLAAVANIILLCVWKKRDEARWTAALQYIDNVCEGTLTEVEEMLDERIAELKKEYEAMAENAVGAAFGQCTHSIANVAAEVEKLKAGAMPDYEAAVAAANAVNDFNAGLAAIMNFDPIEVARARRQGDNREAI